MAKPTPTDKMMSEKKLVSEELTFEVDVPSKYGTVEKFVGSKDYLMMVSQMSSKERASFFEYYTGCDKFEIVGQDCVGGRCFIVVEFFWEDCEDEDL